jgi:gliding motility-associated-like protein
VDIVKPHASFTADPQNGQLPLNVQFTNTSVHPAVTFVWHFDDSNATSTLRDPAHIFKKEGTYRVILTAYDQTGCSDTAGITITVSGELLIFIPNVFTPNTDQINDLFEVIYTKGALKYMKGTIWNRWGTQVYEFEMPGGSWWDGKVGDTYASDGVYFYIIEAAGPSGKVHKFKGTVTLIR